MESCGASSPGLHICTQEKSVITPVNGGTGSGGDFKPKVEKKKTKRREMTYNGTKLRFFNGVHQ